MELQEQLRARGYRLTPQRQLVLDAVTELGHSTPEDVFDWVREHAPGVNVSTIYRTLELLEELGLVTHTHLGHGAPTYHAATAPAHIHLVCRGCGSILELQPSAVDSMVESLREQAGFVADVTHLTVFGECKECAQ
ncbi:MAG: Fur family transcriptional regulator [Nocardioidaceae bacterium]